MQLLASQVPRRRFTGDMLTSVNRRGPDEKKGLRSGGSGRRWLPEPPPEGMGECGESEDQRDREKPP